MKVAVYSIAKNEEHFIERWVESASDADQIVLLDTGSSDKTIELAQSVLSKHPDGFVSTQTFSPWRFDVARNASLSLIDKDIDICIALDVDEVLVDGWRGALEDCLRKNPSTTRPRYKYVWSWKDDGSEGLVYGGDKIHSRHGYVWKHPVHEVIKPIGMEVQEWVSDLQIHHFPDRTKSRSQYFDLLRLAVEEDPADDRNQFYLAREYFFHNQHTDALKHFEVFLTLSRWNAERAAAYRYMAKIDNSNAENLLYKAVAEDPTRRENWLHLARLYYSRRDWRGVKSACEMLFRVVNKPLDYLCDPDAWGSEPHDLMALACYNTGNFIQAEHHGAIAVQLDSSNERLKSNMTHYSNALSVRSGRL